MKALLALAQLALAIGLQAQGTDAATPAPASDRIGTTGPGGGIIFFDKGNSEDGWQFLEAAPADLPEAAWFNGKDGVETGATGTAIGTGKENTAQIIAALGPGSYAAAACRAFGGGGLQDWFLPSKDEMDKMFQVLKDKPGVGFASRFYYYWSSTERNSIESWVENLKDSGEYPNLKGFKHLVRPIREF